jgi:thioester reductase-like protein
MIREHTGVHTEHLFRCPVVDCSLNSGDLNDRDQMRRLVRAILSEGREI